MSLRTPIDIKELSKKGIFNEDRFFRLLSEQNNYVDNKVVKDFYMGFVRHLTKELRDNGVVRLPHIGDIALVRQKDKMGLSGYRNKQMLIGKYAIRFYIHRAWKAYFSKLGEKSGREGLLDPREKVLNKKL